MNAKGKNERKFEKGGERNGKGVVECHDIKYLYFVE